MIINIKIASYQFDIGIYYLCIDDINYYKLNKMNIYIINNNIIN